MRNVHEVAGSSCHAVYCQFCKRYTDRAEDVCRVCTTPKTDMAAHVEAEQKRLKSRESSVKGRQLNRAGTGAAAAVPRSGVGCFDDMGAHDAAVETETAALAAAIGDPMTIATDTSKMALIEGFLLVHYKGELSVQPEDVVAIYDSQF